MKKTLLLACLATLIVNLAAAQVLGVRDTDEVFDREALDARLRGQILVFYDDGASEFYTDGRYTYTYANNGGTGYGYYEVGEDSTVCIEFVTGFSRCDAYVMDAQGRLVVVTETGDRFPVRP